MQNIDSTMFLGRFCSGIRFNNKHKVVTDDNKNEQDESNNNSIFAINSA